MSFSLFASLPTTSRLAQSFPSAFKMSIHSNLQCHRIDSSDRIAGFDRNINQLSRRRMGTNFQITSSTLQLCYQSYIMHWYFMQFHAEGSFSVQWDRSEQCDHSLCSAVHIVRGWHCSRLDTNRFCLVQRLFLTFTFYVHFHDPAWQQGSRCYNPQMLQHMLRISWQLTQGH